MMRYTIIIATSQNRTDWLIKRSLNAVYSQVGIDNKEWNVLVVDDNENEIEFVKIQRRIEELRADLLLKPTEFRTTVLKNKRTRFMSGTGAWNTGIFEAHNMSPNGFVSILDDDDEYLPHHLVHCVSALKEHSVAVFQRLIWHNEDGSTMHVDLTKDQLTTENFFIGNPGVQGSNMFFKTAPLIDIGGFDENLPNTTDRDLMIRFLERNNLKSIEVLHDIGVIHHNHKKQKVNNDKLKKGQGLDLFYKKYKAQFSEEAYHKSLSRAKAFFDYDRKEQIVICMPMRNAERTVEKSIHSVLRQKNTHREIILLIGNDNSTDNSESIVQNIARQNPSVVLLNVDFGSAYLNRNYLNEYARRTYPNCVLIGRLDADDVVYNTETLREIEKRYDESNFDVLICGNKQVRRGAVLEWENRPSSKLLDDDFLLNQLLEMTQGNPKAELPSCNTFIKPTAEAVYPNKASAEDHWFTVFLLSQKEKLNILIDESLIYCLYSLDGFVTSSNKENDSYAQSRIELHTYYSKEVALKKIEQNWKDFSSKEGISFHIQNIQKNKRELEKHWLLSFPLNNRIEKEARRIGSRRLELLDVGCGPFPKSGLYHKDYLVKRVLVDTLANEYHELLKEHSVNTYGQRIISCDAEKIDPQLPHHSFDIIYSKNALDHTYNPTRAILNLTSLIRDGGAIILEHYINEGEYTNYYGLHQWNFFIENGCFCISNENKQIHTNMNSLLPHLEIESFYEKNKIINVIRK